MYVELCVLVYENELLYCKGERQINEREMKSSTEVNATHSPTIQKESSVCWVGNLKCMERKDYHLPNRRITIGLTEQR